MKFGFSGDTQFGPVVGTEATGAPKKSWQECLGVVAEFEKSELLAHLGAINCALGQGGASDGRFQEWLARHFLSPFRWQKLEKYYSRQPDPKLPVVVFDPRAFRRLIMLALQAPNRENGRSLGSASARHDLGDLILSLNSSDAYELGDEESPLLKIEIAMALEQNAYRTDYSFGSKIALFEHYLRELYSQDEVRSAFQESVGCEIGDFLEAQLVLHVTMSNLTPIRLMHGGQRAFNFPAIFGKTRITKSVARIVLSHCAHDLEQEFSAGSSSLRPDLNVGPIINKPFCVAADNLIFLDKVFAVRKLVQGINQAYYSATGEDIAVSFQKKGIPFENFCSTIFGRIAQDRSAKWMPPGTDGKVATDGIYIEADDFLVCEAKSAWVKTNLKLGADATLVAKDIEEKFLVGKDDAKGIEQLARKIEALQKDRRIPQDSRVWPILIVEDPFVSSYPLRDYIRDYSCGRFKGLGDKVRCAEILSYDELILFWLHAEKRSPVDLLETLDMSKGQLSHDNAIAARFGSVSEKSIDLPREMTDAAFKRVIARFQSNNAPQCPKCGKELLAIEPAPELNVWYCSQCERRVRELTLEERADVTDAAQAARQWYENS